MSKICAYCLRSDFHMSKEHVYQKWLTKMFPAPDFKPIISDENWERKYSLNEITIKDVCEKCNNHLSIYDEYWKSVISDHFSFNEKIPQADPRISVDSKKFSIFVIKTIFNLLRFEKRDHAWFSEYPMFADHKLNWEFLNNKQFSIFLGYNSLWTPFNEETAKLALFHNPSFIHEVAPTVGDKMDVLANITGIHRQFYLKLGRANILLFLWDNDLDKWQLEKNQILLRHFIELYGFSDVSKSDHDLIDYNPDLSDEDKKRIKEILSLHIRDSSNFYSPEWRLWVFTLYWDELSVGRLNQLW